jgi:hypothetical protein
VQLLWGHIFLKQHHGGDAKSVFSFPLDGSKCLIIGINHVKFCLDIDHKHTYRCLQHFSYVKKLKNKHDNSTKN